MRHCHYQVPVCLSQHQLPRTIQPFVPTLEEENWRQWFDRKSFGRQVKMSTVYGKLWYTVLKSTLPVSEGTHLRGSLAKFGYMTAKCVERQNVKHRHKAVVDKEQAQ